jgi:hypothetical protein
MNPPNCKSFRPGAIWPDNHGLHINAHGGGVLFHGGLYYWFGEHKVEGEAGNLAQTGVHVYSSRNLYNWSDEGIALSVSDDPKNEIAHGCILERPKVIFNASTRKFVMWFHLERRSRAYSDARSGVALADHVSGPYRFIQSFRPNAGNWPMNVPENEKRELNPDERACISAMELDGAPRPYYPKQLLFRRDFVDGQMARDMTLFVDDDGLAYHIYASEENGTLHISQLSDDYLSPKGKFIRIFPGRFNEAPAMMKWRGRYFLITSDCTGWAPNAARLLSANSIFGNWEELGNPCLGNDLETASTFSSQSTFIFPVHGKPDAFVFMADRWCPKNAIDGRYVWLPIGFHQDVPMIRWHDQWDLNVF